MAYFSCIGFCISVNCSLLTGFVKELQTKTSDEKFKIFLRNTKGFLKSVEEVDTASLQQVDVGLRMKMRSRKADSFA